MLLHSLLIDLLSFSLPTSLAPLARKQNSLNMDDIANGQYTNFLTNLA